MLGVVCRFVIKFQLPPGRIVQNKHTRVKEIKGISEGNLCTIWHAMAYSTAAIGHRHPAHRLPGLQRALERDIQVSLTDNLAP
jgi:hypothetical protein